MRRWHWWEEGTGSRRRFTSLVGQFAALGVEGEPRPFGCFAESSVVGHERGLASLERGSQVQRIKRPSAGLLGNLSRCRTHGRIELDNAEALPVVGELGHRIRVVCTVEESSKVPPRLDQRVAAGHPVIVAGKVGLARTALHLLNIELEQSTRVHVQGHAPRSSASTSATVGSLR